jgi:hypothetical protein
MPSGYSGTPLIKKLGIVPGMKVLLIDSPNNYFDLLENDISGQLVEPGPTPDLVHLFADSNMKFETHMRQLKDVCVANPRIILWVSWYKKSAGIPTDLTEDLIRRYALKNGLVDVKVCAVSEIWSGLKLMVPRAKR